MGRFTLLIAFAGVLLIGAHGRRLGDVNLECTLDSFFLRIKSSTCNCECNGQSVEPTAQAITTATTQSHLLSTTNFPPLPASSSSRPPVAVGCTFATGGDQIEAEEPDDFGRVDCYPDPGASEANCIARGCIWKPSRHPNGQSTGAPWCFKPQPAGSSGPQGFLVSGCSVSDNVAQFKLQRTSATNSIFSTPWKDVTFAIENVGNKIVRFKFYDAVESRYEVPVPINKPTDGATDPQYEVKVFNEPIFYFKVIRKSTGAVLFDTSAAGLVLEDQYLQIKTKLATNKVYGFGENRRRSLKHSDVGAIAMWTKDSPPTYENGNHYGFFPYYVVVESDGKAHGVLLRTSNGMEYQVGSSKLTLKTMGGILDFYAILGDSPEQVTELYTGLVGRPFMPPYWSLGFQLSRWGYNTLPGLRRIIDRNRAAGVPQDVQTLDIDHMRHRQNFIHDWDNFNGLSAYIEEIKRNGIRTIIILDPGIHADAPIKHPRDPPYLPYTHGIEQDVYIKWPAAITAPNPLNNGPNKVLLGKVWPDGRVAFPDFFTQKARKWWMDEIKEAYKTIKFDGLWIDMNEPANFGGYCPSPGNHTCIGMSCPATPLENPPWKGRIGRPSDNTICMEVEQECRPGQMCKHYDVHNLYGWSQSEPTQAAARGSTGKRSIVVSRSTYPGVGQHVGHWLGDNQADWSDLRYSVIGIQEFNVLGIPYIGADICGFFNTPSEELCARWQQVGAFYTYSRNHNGNGNRDQDPAEWPLVADVTKKALAIRYRLLPYLYTLFYHAHTRGSTVIRPLHHEFASEEAIYDINDQFLWGAGLMIAPVLQQGANSRSVYFPVSQWYEYSGKKLSHRGAAVEIPMPIDQIGVYLRGGHIFPAQKAALNTVQSRKNPFEFIVAVEPSTGSASGDVYWDDGDSIDSIQKGAFIFGNTIFSASADRATFELAVSKAGTFTENDVKVSEINIYGLPFTASRVTLNNGQSASVKAVNGITTVTLNAPLKTSFIATILRS